MSQSGSTILGYQKKHQIYGVFSRLLKKIRTEQLSQIFADFCN